MIDNLRKIWGNVKIKFRTIFDKIINKIWDNFEEILGNFRKYFLKKFYKKPGIAEILQQFWVNYNTNLNEY